MIEVAAARTTASEAPVRRDGAYVLYWMTAARRTSWSFALDRAIAWARVLRKPLLVAEPLRADEPRASDRLHAFVLAGMRTNRVAFRAAGVAYHPYVEPAAGAGAGLLAALAAPACLVVADDVPGAGRAPGERAELDELADGPVRVERVDGDGLLPFREPGRTFAAAVHFRRHLQAVLPGHLEAFPAEAPLSDLDLPPGAVPADVAARWPEPPPELLAASPAALAALPIDHAVGPVASRPGGAAGAAAVLARFLDVGLERYMAERRDPDAAAASGLSPYLRHGHLGVHEVVARVLRAEGWTPARLGRRPNGAKAGWWGASEAAEAFLDELVTWRELSANGAAHVAGFERYDSLPAWARASLEAHAGDPRPAILDLEALAAGRSPDPVWNAAQGQLREEGTIHNYLRMVWGKRLLEWTPEPAAAFEAMVALNDRYALDGRCPNSYAGIGWVLGRYDRPWGPERAIFGVVRYMSSAATLKKVKMRDYMARWGEMVQN